MFPKQTSPKHNLHKLVGIKPIRSTKKRTFLLSHSSLLLTMSSTTHCYIITRDHYFVNTPEPIFLRKEIYRVFHSLTNAKSVLHYLRSTVPAEYTATQAYVRDDGADQLEGFTVQDESGRTVQSVNIKKERFGDGCVGGRSSERSGLVG
jgi:hypothetical protein